MRKGIISRLRISIVVLLTIFSLSSTMVPTTALDLGAKAKYIISVTPTAKAAIEAAVTKNGWKIDSKYNYVFDGYTVELPKLVASLLAKIPNVLTVEEDKEVLGSAIQNTQSPTPAWGMDRVDQREKVGLPGAVSAYGYRSAGAGATIYIGDTGIYPHGDLAGRISTSGYSAINDGNGTVDCNGHGTHVAATAAGTTYGLAKKARVVPVRILNCTGSGTYSGVMAGLDWILSPENPNPKTQAVLNLSIGGGASAALNAAILRLTNAGITVVAAAGNDAVDACTKSPASAPTAITVGATTSMDAAAYYTNQGKCVDIFAPGSSILSAWFGSPTATYTASGTSMATPHVTGAAAIYLGLNPTASVAQVAQYLDAESTKDALTALKVDTVNKLLYVSPTDGGAPIVAPVVAQKTITNITHQSADVLIDVNPGFAPTTLSFEYGTDSTFASSTSATVLPGMVDGGAPTTASVKLTGLNPSITYFFRIIGVNESGRTVSNTGSFTTLPPPVTAPIARVAAATNITAYSATLNGVVQAGNAATKATFMYGTDPDFKVNTSTVAASPFEISGGTNFYNVTLNISFLDGGKTYYYKVVAINSTGTTHSPVMTFDTPVAPGLPPTATTSNIPVSRSVGTAEFVGTVNPKGQTTTVQFVWGYEKSLTSGQKSIIIPQSPITGVADVAVNAKPTGLLPGYGVYFQFVASNASGITKSIIQYAIMSPETPVISSVSSAAVTSNSVKLYGLFNAMGSNTRVYFDYSKDSTFATGTTSVQASPWAVANAANTSLTAAVTGLTPSTQYFWRLRVATANSAAWKEVLSAVQNFTTSAVVVPTPTPTPAPVVPGVDKEKPVIISASTTPQNLEVCQTVTQISVKAVDNVGITTANLRIYNPNNVLVNSMAMYKISGTAQSGTWANDWTIPCNALIGKYTARVQLSDAAGNLTYWGDLPNFWVVASTVMDKSAPVFVSGTVSPGPILVGQTIPEITARITDDTGVLSVTLTIVDPKGSTIGRTSAMRTSGTKLDGIYRNDWATKSTYVSGRYSIYVEGIDEWQKSTGLKLVGYIDINPAPVTSPAPAPIVSPSDAPMKVTPYYSNSTARNSTLTPATGISIKMKTTSLFVASTLYANGNNSGLLSFGHLLEVSTSTPTVCSVTGVTTWDRLGGIYTRATINTLATGTCSVLWKFNGYPGRAPTSTTMNLTVTP